MEVWGPRTRHPFQHGPTCHSAHLAGQRWVSLTNGCPVCLCRTVAHCWIHVQTRRKTYDHLKTNQHKIKFSYTIQHSTRQFCSSYTNFMYSFNVHVILCILTKIKQLTMLRIKLSKICDKMQIVYIFSFVSTIFKAK